MGCCATSRSLRHPTLSSPEETAILYQETQLGCGIWQVSKALEVLDRHSQAGVLTIMQLRDFSRELKADLSSEFESSKEAFMRYFRGQKVGFDGFKLAVLLVLLCKGSIWEKAGGLFTHCPSYQDDHIASQDIALALTTLLELSIDVLPSLAAAEHPVKGQSMVPDMVQQYQARLNRRRIPVWRRLYVGLVLTNTQLTSQEFTARMGETVEEGELLSSQGVRELLYVDSSVRTMRLLQ